MSVDFDIAAQLLIRYSTFIRFCTKSMCLMGR